MARLEGLLSILFKRLNHSKGEVYMPLTKDAESTLIFVCFVLFPSLRRDLDMLFVGDLKSPNTRKESIMGIVQCGILACIIPVKLIP